MAAIAANWPSSFQLGSIAVLAMSDARANSSASRIEEANRSQIAFFDIEVAEVGKLPDEARDGLQGCGGDDGHGDELADHGHVLGELLQDDFHAGASRLQTTTQHRAGASGHYPRGPGGAPLRARLGLRNSISVSRGNA